MLVNDPPADPALPLVTGLAKFKRLEAQFLRPHRAAMALAIVGMLVQSLLLLLLPLIQGWVLDRLVPWFSRSATISSAEWWHLGRLIAIAFAATVGCHLVRMLLSWWITAKMARLSLEVVRSLTDALHRKLQRLPMAYYDRQQTGRVMARVTNDVGSLLIFLNGGSLQLASDLVLAMGISVVLVWLQWQLALVSLVVVPLYALNHKLFANKIHELSKGVRAQVAAIYALLSERVSAVRVVRSFTKEEAEVAELDARIDTHRSLNWLNMKAGAWQGALATLISGLGTVFVIAYGTVLVARGRLTVGELLAFYALVGQLYNPIVRLTGFQAMMAATTVAVDRIIELLDEPETVTDRPHARRIVRPKGSLVYRNVSFAYSPHGRRVLERVNLTIEPGMTVGILGRSGAGKSTLLALAPRLYDVPEGQGTVLFDGRDVRGLRLADLRKTVALVPQQAMLFEGTIRSNLLYAAPGASDSAIKRSLEASDFARTVANLPLGLDTPVGERGQTLSGGQRQRLALARALVANPSVLLLDDCTSALDAETEARIQATLETLRAGRTCVIVSHKVASVRRADQIVVLEGGKILELGTHEELLQQGGSYAQTYAQQTSALAVCESS